jgi:hypothetical protein
MNYILLNKISSPLLNIKPRMIKTVFSEIQLLVYELKHAFSLKYRNWVLVQIIEDISFCMTNMMIGTSRYPLCKIYNRSMQKFRRKRGG